jgi:outer membrane lipopolysaccharide assembly protein LptE/RlpB
VKKYFIILFLLLFSLVISSCGYQLRGTQELRTGLQTVAIVPVINKTFESRIENDLYNALVDEFAQSKNLTVVPVKDADLLVAATVVAVENYSISYSSDDKTYEYRVVMTIDAEAKESAGGKVLWRRSALQEVEEYKADEEPLTIDRRKQAALRRVCKVLAEDVHDGLFTGF